MAYPRTPGGLFPLTTAPTGNNAGGLYPTTDRLVAAIRSLAPTAYWKMDEASGNLADAMSGAWPASVTGSPTYGVAAPSPIGRGVTWSGTGQYAATNASFPAPSASMSAVAFYSTTYASGAAKALLGRGNAAQESWVLRHDANYRPQAVLINTASGVHVFQTAVLVSNTGAWHMAAFTFSGTVLTVIGANASSFVTNTSSSLTGSWRVAPTDAVGVAARTGTDPWAGTMAHAAVFNDRVLSLAELRHIASVAFGG